jgi:hypothetical protein
MLVPVNGWLHRRRRHKQVQEEQASIPRGADARVALVDLSAWIDSLLDAAEARFGPELQFPEDFYWDVPFSEATQVDSEPEPYLGSVVDDTESLRDFLARDPSEHVSIWHEADHIAGVLRAIARRDLSQSP